MTIDLLEKRERLADPVATMGDRLYVISSQNGLFPDPWSRSHVPHELWGVWAHPIKLLDGFWLALHNRTTGVMTWLLEADACRVGGLYTEFVYRVEPLRVTRRDFVPDGVAGLLVKVTIELPTHFADEIELVALVRSDLRPAWLGEEAGLVDGPDQIEIGVDGDHIVFTDQQNPWSALVGGDRGSNTVREIITGPAAGVLQPTVGQGATARLTLPLQRNASRQATATLYIAGSAHSLVEAQSTLATLRREGDALYQAKAEGYEQLTRQCALASPDPALDHAFTWSKYTCQMLTRTTADFGPGVGAGLPHYPWWFGIDSEYAVLPMLQAGLFALTKSTLRLLKRVSEQHNPTTPGRVIHELSTTGVVYNPGNLVETPIFTRAVYQTWLWSGDQALLAEMYPFCKQGLLTYTLGQCDPDGDLCPAGRSIIETLEMHAGLACLDVACYTWEALGCLAAMAQELGDTAILPELEAKAAALGACISRDWWLPEAGLFADMRATVQEVHAALTRIDELATTSDGPGLQAQITQAHHLLDAQLATYSQGAHDVRCPWLLRHWIVLCPLEVELATPEQAQRTLARLLTPEFCNEWGMYLHPERQDVMSINSGLLALALARYGRMEDALKLTQAMASTLMLRTPGAISEALPDQWCFLQLWSALGIISPVVEGIFGVQVNAAARRLTVIPQLPATWPEATLRQLRVGDHHFDLHVSRNATGLRLVIQGDASDYQIRAGFFLPPAQITHVHLNGHPITPTWSQRHGSPYFWCEAVGEVELEIG
ncbi:MAG: hypothetical protein R3C14_47430 [Caldilineaceae bacterium]